MPAAAVIPAPVAYAKVVAVEKLVVEFLAGMTGPLHEFALIVCVVLAFFCIFIRIQSFTVKKLECLKQDVYVWNIIVWNNKIRPLRYFIGLHARVMMNRDSWGYSYLDVRGEILGFSKDERLRKHLSWMFSLIKNDSLGIEDD